MGKRKKIGTFPQETLPNPSDLISDLKASNAKNERIRIALDRTPQVGDSATTYKGTEQWTLQDAADYKEYTTRKSKGHFIKPLPFFPLPNPSDLISDLQASNAKNQRIRKVLGKTPQVGDSVTTSKGSEQWTLQDASNYKEYRRRQGQGEFTKPLPFFPLPNPSDLISDLQASNAKNQRIRKVLNRAPQVGDSATTSIGSEQWTLQDDANYNEYKKRQGQGEFRKLLPFFPLPNPSDQTSDLKASNAKNKRIRKVLNRAPQVGNFATTCKGSEQWTPEDDANYKEYTRRQGQGEFKKTLPFVSLPSSDQISELKASNAKNKRIRRVLNRAPQVRNFATTCKGSEQWTPQDDANYKEYTRRQGQGEFKKTLPSVFLPSPSDQTSDLQASNAKYKRIKKVLDKIPQVGNFVTTSTGSEQWTSQDASNYKEYNRRKNKGMLKVPSGSGNEAANATLPQDTTAFFIPGNSDKKSDPSRKRSNEGKDPNSPLKRPKIGSGN